MRSMAATRQPGACIGSARRAPVAVPGVLLRAAAASRACRTGAVAVSATMRNSRTSELRRLLKGNDILLVRLVRGCALRAGGERGRPGKMA